MRVIGIDPGYALVGWSILDITHENTKIVDCGVIETAKELSISERLSEVFKDITALLDEYNPEYAGIETLMFHKNVTTVMSVSEARGVILLAISLKEIPVTQVTPLQVKSAVTGYGKANKSQVQESIKLRCGLNDIIKPDDAADAVAVAICVHAMIESNMKLK